MPQQVAASNVRWHPAGQAPSMEVVRDGPFNAGGELDTMGLRAYLLTETVEFREILAHPVRPSNNGRPDLDGNEAPQRHALNFVIWERLLGPVDAIADGGAYRFERWELPDGHFALGVGGRNDIPELGADNLLRLVIV